MSKPTMHFRPIALTQALFAMVVLLFLSSTTAIAQDDRKAVIRGRSAAAAEAGLGDLYAVVVGISKYKNPKIPPLKVSDKDAKDFAEFLNGQEGLFKKVHVALLTNELATKAEVEKHLYHKLRQAHKDDTVVVFLSGHGSDDAASPGDFFFLTHDADPDYLEATAVNMSSQRFTQRMESRRILLIADACHAGGFSTQVSKAVVRSREHLLRMFKDSEGRVFVTSSRADELSQEKPELGNSIFTYYLIEGLKGAADQDMDGVVTLKELYEYVYKSTRQATAGYQSPQMEGKIVGPFALALCNTHPGSLSTTAQPRVPLPPPAEEPADEMAKLRKRAESGDATAQFELGTKYEHGWDVQPDREEALVWYRRAAGKGNKDAEEALARLQAAFDPGKVDPVNTGLSVHESGQVSPPHGAFVHAAEKISPAVVHISASKKGSADRPVRVEVPDGFPSRDFFGEPFSDILPKVTVKDESDTGSRTELMGSGVIVSADGLILTNSHLIKDFDEVTVTLRDKRFFKAQVVGIDLESDIAVIRIDATGLPIAALGDSSKLRVGETALAFGDALEVKRTPTSGIGICSGGWVVKGIVFALSE